MNIKEYPDRDMLALAVADRLAGDLNNHLLHHDTAALAVAGGTTPGPIFDDLCAADLDWSRVTVMASDERWVPVDHERSNARLIRERLMVNRAEKAELLSYYQEGKTPEEAAAELSPKVGAHRPLAAVLLGMGEDMHTASLFPGAPGLEDALAADAPELVVVRPDSQPEVRFSLSAPVLNGALAKHLVIFGEAKRAALEVARTLPPEDAPIAAVLSECNVHWAP